MEGMVDAVRRPPDTARFSASPAPGSSKGIRASLTRADSGFAHIEDAHAGALVGEGDSERQADMPTTANNHHIAFENTI